MAKTFTKIGKDIVIAVKEGGSDPETNARLRAVMQNAKTANMPKENVERAIKKAIKKAMATNLFWCFIAKASILDLHDKKSL